MKTKQVIGIIVGIVGVVAIYFSLKEYSGIGATLGVLLTAFGALYPFIFKDKQKPVVVLSKDYLHELAGEEIALRDKTIEELRQQLAEKDLPDYKEAVKPYVDEGNYAKAIELVNPDGAAEEAAEEAAEKYIFQAQLYIAGYQFKEAGEHYRKAVEIFPSAENTFAAAEFYQELNRVNDAKEYYERCLEMELLPVNRASVLNNLGNIFEQSNDYPEAEKAYAEALKIKRTLADEDPQTYKPTLAVTLNNLGALHSKKGEYEQADNYYKEALEIRRELAKKDPDTYNPDLAITLNNLGCLHHDQEDYDQAKGYHKEALQLRRGLAAKDAKTYNPDLATSLNNLG
ncbi:MAG: tetratricopeptide repeat protein, partial [Tannerellaceae bacterium]|nr:tetratricopeptide repeat protein [Tannerellaceae bacterium]